jgi:hypothetical protein
MLGIALVAFFYFVEWLDRRSEEAGHYRMDQPVALPGPNRALSRAIGTRDERAPALPGRGERYRPLPAPLPKPGRPS